MRRRPRERPGAPAGAGRGASDAPLPRAVTCPFCSGRDTELFSPFGTVASVAQYYCRACRTVFEYVKWGRETRPPQHP